jgi:predicted Zn-dependent protease with MMP-like domain
MQICPVCSINCNDQLCECGYSFAENAIGDWGKLKETLAKIPHKNWPRSVKMINAVYNIQIAIGRTGKETADKLGIIPMRVSRVKKLAKAICAYPQLEACPNEDAATRELTNIINESGSNFFRLESYLQKFLESHWDNTELATSWNLYRNGHVQAGCIGIIDILARHKIEPKWLVIELKVRKTSDEVLGQLLRYMGWVRIELAKVDETVDGLIIGSSPDIKTLYGLHMLTNATFMQYKLHANSIKLYEKNLTHYQLDQLQSNGLSDDELKELYVKLKRESLFRQTCKHL